MSRFFIVIVLSIILFSCKSGVPKNIIQPAAMENVLFDIHVVDGYSTVYSGITNDSLKKIIAPYYKGIYKKHGIDSASYHNSLDYYYNHPELLKTMYDNVSKKLTQAKEKIVKDEAKAALKLAKEQEKAAKIAAQKLAKEREIAAKKLAAEKEAATKKAALEKAAAIKKAAEKKAKNKAIKKK